MRAQRRIAYSLSTGPKLIHLALYTVESDLEEEFGTWYETEHAPEVLRRAGWRRMWRYQCVDGQPFASLYELDDDLPTEPHLSAAPFRSNRFAARGLRDYHARTWRKIHSVGDPPDQREWLNIVTVDVEAAHADAFNRWYNEVHVPEILTCPGWIANRRYECLDGGPRFLAVYDLEDATRPFASPEWEGAVGWDEHVEHIRGFHGFRVYSLIFECAA
jgi:hypothetical protein